MLVETIFKMKNIQLLIILKFSERNEIVSIVCSKFAETFLHNEQPKVRLEY